MTIYRMLLRPVSRFTLPDGLDWEYVAAPPDIAHRRPDLPAAPWHWPFGTFSTNRPLTADELRHFSIEEVN